MTESRGHYLRWAMSTACLSIGLAVTIFTSPAFATSCTLPAQYAGVPYPVEEVDPEWTCRIHSVVNHYTTANKVGPIRLALPMAMYDYLLDHPDIAAALVNRLDLGLYKAEMQAPDRFWGTDGEGNQGIVQVTHRNKGARMYFLEGTHDGRILPRLRGTAVVLIQASPLRVPDGTESVEAVILTYLRIQNPVIAGLASLVRPMATSLVRRQLEKAIHAATGLSRAMHREPERVLFEASDPPPLSGEAVEFLRMTLPRLSEAGRPSAPQIAP